MKAQYGIELGNGHTHFLDMTFEVPGKEIAGLDTLRDWNERALLIPRSKLRDGIDTTEHTNARQYLNCMFALAEVLFQQSGLPVFEKPRIDEVSRVSSEKRMYKVKIRYFEIDEAPKDIFKFMYNTCLRLCNWMLENELTEKNQNKFYEMIMEKVISPIKKSFPSGKSTMQILRYAHEARIPYRHIGLGAYLLGWGSKAIRLDRSVTDLDSAIALRLSQSKTATANFLRNAGLPAPKHKVVGDKKSAQKAALYLKYPVVIKPNDLERGEGVTVDISDDNALIAAFESAKKLSPSKRVLVEKQVEGVCHRVFITGGQMLYAVRRNAMSVVGNGKNTVLSLLDEELQKQCRMPPWMRSEIEPMDDLARESIKRAGHTLDSIPKEGEKVPLRRIESTLWGGVDEEVTRTIHPENIRIAIDAAALFGLNTAGVDIICEDISIPWFKSGAIINEVNFAPMLGGAEISRGYVSEYLSRAIDGDGRIPVRYVSGKKAKKAAMEMQQKLLDKGLRCYLTSVAQTIDHNKKVVPLALNTLLARVRALLMRKDVDALVVVGD
ncbi:MAG: hypothetical protein R3332_08535 [Pseudohongiellaceae bacterium]|nr:hypothetical protein [Pseudohongiellaceae bacterium]